MQGLQYSSSGLGGYAAAIILFIGFLIGFVVYSRFKVQIGGVIATPLRALYTIADPRSLVVFAVAAAASYATIEALVEYTLMYGRRLYYFSAMISIIATFALLRWFQIEQAAYFSVIPAIIGYNLYRESESAERLTRSLAIWLVEFASILTVAYLILGLLG